MKLILKSPSTDVPFDAYSSLILICSLVFLASEWFDIGVVSLYSIVPTYTTVLIELHADATNDAVVSPTGSHVLSPIKLTLFK